MPDTPLCVQLEDLLAKIKVLLPQAEQAEALADAEFRHDVAYDLRCAKARLLEAAASMRGAIRKYGQTTSG